MATRKRNRKRRSDGGAHTQRGFLLRETEPEQLDTYREFAARAGLTLTAWLHRAAEREIERHLAEPRDVPQLEPLPPWALGVAVEDE